MSVGFWFSLGPLLGRLRHGAAASRSGSGRCRAGIGDDGSTLQQVTGVWGTLVSGVFLLLIGLINLSALVGILQVFRELRSGRFDEAELDRQLDSRGLLNRILGRVTRAVTQPWHMYPTGFLFGLGFDTVSEIGLLVIAGGAVAASLPWWAVLTLPVLFAAGMSLLDTLDGAFMNVAYGWAFARPVRKIYYNLTVTALSVAVALVIGGVELLGLLADRLGITTGPVAAVARRRPGVRRLRHRGALRAHLGGRGRRLEAGPHRRALERPPRRARRSGVGQPGPSALIRRGPSAHSGNSPSFLAAEVSREDPATRPHGAARRAARLGAGVRHRVRRSRVRGSARPPHIPTLVGIRAAHHPGFDRVVFVFRGGVPASHRVAYVPGLVADGSGLPVRIAGRAFLGVRFEPTNAHDANGAATAPARRSFALPNVITTVRAGDFEAVTTYGVGLAKRTPFHVSTLTHPGRVVVDVAAAFRTVDRRVYFFDQGAFLANREPFFTPRLRPVRVDTPAVGVLDRLFAGPLVGEHADGLRLLRSGASGFTGLSIADHVARVRLTGGCSSGGSTVTVAGEIMPTLRQFPSVDWVKIYDPSGHTERPHRPHRLHPHLPRALTTPPTRRLFTPYGVDPSLVHAPYRRPVACSRHTASTRRLFTGRILRTARAGAPATVPYSAGQERPALTDSACGSSGRRRTTSTSRGSAPYDVNKRRVAPYDVNKRRVGAVRRQQATVRRSAAGGPRPSGSARGARTAGACAARWTCGSPRS